MVTCDSRSNTFIPTNIRTLRKTYGMNIRLDHVKSLLFSLRERPQAVEISDNILQDVYLFLMNLPPLNDEVHWFCDKADTTTIEAATFLIRLFAYDSEEVKQWKERLQKCVSTCLPCVQGLEQKKILSRQTYVSLH